MGSSGERSDVHHFFLCLSSSSRWLLRRRWCGSLCSPAPYAAMTEMAGADGAVRFAYRHPTYCGMVMGVIAGCRRRMSSCASSCRTIDGCAPAAVISSPSTWPDAGRMTFWCGISRPSVLRSATCAAVRPFRIDAFVMLPATFTASGCCRKATTTSPCAGC